MLWLCVVYWRVLYKGVLALNPQYSRCWQIDEADRVTHVALDQWVVWSISTMCLLLHICYFLVSILRFLSGPIVIQPVLLHSNQLCCFYIANELLLHNRKINHHRLKILSHSNSVMILKCRNLLLMRLNFFLTLDQSLH